MIAIAENGVQSRQVLTVTFDGRRAARQVRSNLRTIHGRKLDHARAAPRRLLLARGQRGASVATLGAAVPAPAGIPSCILILLCWLLDESCPTIGTIPV